MKKILKMVLYGIIVVIIVMVFFSVLYLIKFKSEIKKMTPIKTEKIVDNIFTIHDSFVNLFLIKDSNQYIAIDAGNNLKTVTEELHKLHIAPDKIAAVFLTHTHGDHVAAIKLFKKAKIYLSRQEEQMINGKKKVFLWFGNKIDTKGYSLIDDNQVLNIGNIKIKGILTPGHTPGSMSYLINDTYLFVGDALSIKSGKIAEFNDFFNMDSKAAISSLDKITLITGCVYMFSAHYGFTGNYIQAVKDWKKLK
jgi:hydroxyacylglutathione hydrolase